MPDTPTSEMMQAATKALYERAGYDYTTRENVPYRAYWKEANWQAKCALEAAGVATLVARIAELEAELAQFQTSKFHPDWSLLEAAQENLREAWARIRELESELKTIARIGADDVPGSE